MRKQINDFEPKMSYDRLSKRQLKKRLKTLFWLIVTCLLLGFAVHKLHAEALCVQSPNHGYYVRDNCPNDKCCEPLQAKMVDGHIQLI
jgi:hypothetical protein